MMTMRGPHGWAWELTVIVVLVSGVVFAVPVCGQAAPQAGTQPKLKAIWEPVNVPEDLELKSVYFVSADEGWVAGGKHSMLGGVIYHTTDGGQSWQLQIGDPESSDGGFSDLQFADPKHGFAVQGSSDSSHQLFSTSDGVTWVPSGRVPGSRYDSFFTSPTTGFVADWANQIVATRDAGKTWQSVYTCRIKAEINGLTREADCFLHSIHFPNPNVGYAIGGPLPENSGNVLAKTEDGGATWTAWVVLPGESAHEGSLWFMDEENGVFRAKDRKLFRTADGGKTWTGVSGQGELKSEVVFADAEAGWMIYYQKMTYTGNGGKSWVSRDIAFPAMVEDSCLPARDRGYVVGAHGMVYRYRIVPADYTSKGMLGAPALAR